MNGGSNGCQIIEAASQNRFVRGWQAKTETRKIRSIVV